VAERERVLRHLGSLAGLRAYPSRANFILVEFLEGDPKGVFEALYARGILVRDVTSYPRLERCLRVSVGSPAENEAFLQALPAALASAGVAERRR
jgi:histidinol-phosphate aminotransferase